MHTRWRFAWAWTIGVVLAASCGGNPPPPPPEPCKPVPDVEGTAVWKGADQVLVSWPDMPGVVVGGGNETCVLRRRVIVEMAEPREISTIATFMAVDSGDLAEGTTVVYNQDGQTLYFRAPHWSGGAYEASHSAPPLIAGEVGKLFIDILHRTVGNNASGGLSSRPHYTVTVSFAGSGPPPPPPTCSIPAANDPKWILLDVPRTTREQLEAAKAKVGNRTGKDPLETLALLAQAVIDVGGCALGPWEDELAILAGVEADGTLLVDGWHAVAFGTGDYTLNPGGDRWAYPAAPAGCGAPTPPAVALAKVKLHQVEPKRTYDSTFLVRGADYCAAIGYTDGRLYCPVRPDGHPEREACEQLAVGTPQWTFEGTSSCFARPNPYQYRCEDDAHGTLTVCSSKAPDVWASIEVE